jgi:hypothetical protein
MEAIYSSETSVDFEGTTWRYTLEYGSPKESVTLRLD